MTGALLNAAGIVAGGAVGLVRRRPLPPASEAFFKTALGAFAVFYGLRLTWLSVNGSAGQILKQLLILILSLTAGKVTGKLLRLQKISNRIGQGAREHIARTGPGHPDRASDGFKICSTLFCAAPMAVLGSLSDGLSNYFYPLAVKAVMDGLGTMGFVALFGWGATVSAIPVLALEGTITLASMCWLKPFLAEHNLIDPVNAAGGMLVFCVAMLILGLRKIEVTDYLPALAYAPLLAWGLHHMG